MGKRKLLLINPIQWLGGRRQRGWNGTRFVPPLNLAYVAALTPSEWETRIVDENTGCDASRVAGFAPDLVGLSSYTATIPRAYALAAHYRAQRLLRRPDRRPLRDSDHPRYVGWRCDCGVDVAGLGRARDRAVVR